MSLPSRDYYLQMDGKKFVSINDGQIKFVKDMSKAFNFHSHDQAETFIDFLKKNHYNSGRAIELTVYRY